jgi:hypothetical protein
LPQVYVDTHIPPSLIKAPWPKQTTDKENNSQVIGISVTLMFITVLKSLVRETYKKHGCFIYSIISRVRMAQNRQVNVQQSLSKLPPQQNEELVLP